MQSHIVNGLQHLYLDGGNEGVEVYIMQSHIVNGLQHLYLDGENEGVEVMGDMAAIVCLTCIHIFIQNQFITHTGQGLRVQSLQTVRYTSPNLLWKQEYWEQQGRGWRVVGALAAIIYKMYILIFIQNQFLSHTGKGL